MAKASAPSEPAICESTIPIVAVGGHVIVKRKDADKTTKGGLVLPDSATKKTTEGIVVSIGTGRDEFSPLAKGQLAVGDTVYWVSFGGHIVEINDTEYFALREEDILCKATPN